MRKRPLWCIVAILASCSDRPDSSSAPSLSAVLIVVDTLRADRLGCYGADRDTSPRLDAFAREAVRFDRAYSTAPWTKPAVATLLTGLYPRSHGADSVQAVLPEDISTLAERLQGTGRRTAAVVSGSFVMRRYGLGQGFEVFDETQVRGHDAVSSQEVTRRALEFVAECAAEEQPFFLFVHYFDPHYSYKRHPRVDFAPESAGRLQGGEGIQSLRDSDPPLDEGEIEFLRSLYDEEIWFTDRAIGRLLRGLTKNGLDRDTVVLVTADHGEEFLEHGWLGHTRSMFEPVLRVPLLLRLPDRSGAGTVVESPVSVASVVPTLLEVLGVDSSGDLPAESLLGQLQQNGAAGDTPRDPPSLSDPFAYAEVDFMPIFAENQAKLAVQKVLVSGRYKLIRDERGGSTQLFDLQTDPAEAHDLSASQPEIARTLSGLLDEHVRRHPRREAISEAELDEAEKQRLRDLGYADR